MMLAMRAKAPPTYSTLIGTEAAKASAVAGCALAELWDLLPRRLRELR